MHARRMRYLITGSERPALATESGAASALPAASAVGVGRGVGVGLPEAVAVAVAVGLAVAVDVGVAVAVAVGVGARGRRSSSGNAERVYPIVIRDVDASTSDDATVPSARAGHQFVRAAASINHRAGVTIVTVQPLVA